MHCTLRIPDVLQARIDEAAGNRGRSEWILEACRMRLDAAMIQEASRMPDLPTERVGEILRGMEQPKPDVQALRDICAGKVVKPEDCIQTHWGIVPCKECGLTELEQAEFPMLPRCRECDSAMREVKGKWACADQSCPIYGKEQKA